MEQAKVYKEVRVSKNNVPYEVLIVDFNGYQKVIFMNDAEKIVYKDLPIKKEG